jgi:hypothetical protein
MKPRPIRRARTRKPRGHEGKHSGERYVLIGTGGCDSRKRGGENGRRRRIGADHQVPGGAEQGEQRHGNEDGVETGDHRRAGDPGVAHHFRDGERRQRYSGDYLGRYLGWRDGQYALQYRQAENPGHVVCRSHRILSGLSH